MEIGEALQHLSAFCLHRAGTNDRKSGRYRRSFSELCEQFGFGAMDHSLRSKILKMMEPETRSRIEWHRTNMSTNQRLKINHPATMLKYLKEHDSEPDEKSGSDNGQLKERIAELEAELQQALEENVELRKRITQLEQDLEWLRNSLPVSLPASRDLEKEGL